MSKRYDGYVIVDSQQMDCCESNNCHVLPATIVVNDDNTRGWEISCRQTICKENVHKTGKLYCISGRKYLASEVDKLRRDLAEMQNGTYEICGVCVSHYYADYPKLRK